MKKFILFFIDTSSLAIAFLISLFIRQSSFIIQYFEPIFFNIQHYLLSFIFACFLLLITFSGFKLYQIRKIELSARIFTVIKALITWAVIIATIIYFIKYDFSRGIFFMTVGFTIIFICMTRYFIFKQKQNNSDDNVETTIIGTGQRALDIEKQIKEIHPKSICNKLDFSNKKTIEILTSLKSTEIFLADELLSRDQVLSIIANESFGHHSFRVILDVFRLATGEVRLNEIDEIPSIDPKNEPNTGYKITKRTVDILISSLGLIITSPLWLIVAILIKLDSKGPVMIKQKRIGWNGKPFTILKFRTMKNDADLYELAPKQDKDQRITRIGKILRRFSLDELPQLFNILIGDMSLVGPRPEMEFIVQDYANWQKFRLKAKPGLTGLWQILGRKNIPLHENLEYDFYYVTNRNLFLDISIILKTVPAVLFGRGAY
jgi:exopolysaccharide biosynthesis polyprenyl glycosylphosphotransferase